MWVTVDGWDRLWVVVGGYDGLWVMVVAGFMGGWQASYSLSPICGFEWSMAMDWCLPIWLCLLGFDML